MNLCTPLPGGGASVSSSLRYLSPNQILILDLIPGRPLMVPIYLSAPAFNYASMTSYTTFSFLHHIRYTAFFDDEHGSLRDGLAETFNYYSQNLPTVALLLPRAGLAMALLFSFSSLNQDNAASFTFTTSRRDLTFFHQADGTLTGYAKGLLYANAAWTAWRILVLVTSWCVFPCSLSLTF